MITQILVGLVDGFKEYLDRQFSSGSCALNVYTLSKVNLSVTNCKLTLCILAKKPLLHTDTKKRSKYVNASQTRIYAYKVAAHKLLKLDL